MDPLLYRTGVDAETLASRLSAAFAAIRPELPFATSIIDHQDRLWPFTSVHCHPPGLQMLEYGNVALHGGRALVGSGTVPEAGWRRLLAELSDILTADAQLLGR